MLRFVTFVDGSNLDGVLKHLNLRVDDYGSFYRHVFEQSVHYWGRTFAEGSPWPTAQHSRIYWYVVGKMDEWDLNDPKAEARLRSRFELNPRLRDSYLEDVARRLPDLPADRRIEEAWNLCFAETREWYEGKRRALERKKRFYHGVQAATDFVEIRQEGHWKVDLLHHTRQREGARHQPGRRHGRAPGHLRHRALDLGRRRRHPGDQLRQGPVEARRRGRVPPRGPGRLPGQGGVVAAQDRRRLRRAGLRGRPDPPQPRLPRRDRLPVADLGRRRSDTSDDDETAYLIDGPDPRHLMRTPPRDRPASPGTNCDEETAAAWQLAGAEAETWHVGRLLESPDALDAFQILTIPGGFSYGDDLGAGRIFATRLGTVLGDALRRFHDRGGLVLGICNGFQVLVKAGLLPGGPALGAATLDPQRLGPLRVALGPARAPTPGLSPVPRPTPSRSSCPSPTARGGSSLADPRPSPRSRRPGQVVLRYVDADGPADAGLPGQPQRLARGRRGRLRPDRPDLRPDAPPRAARRPAPPPPLDPPRASTAEGDGLRIFRNAVKALTG